jgi:hypothetical protein
MQNTYTIVNGKITQTVEVEIKPEEIKNQLFLLKQREKMFMENLANVRNAIVKLQTQIETVKIDTGIEILSEIPNTEITQ